MSQDRLRESQRVLEEAERLYDADQVQTAYDRMAEAISLRLSDANPVVVCVMMGGLVTTAELIRRFDFPFELDYLHATRYRGDTHGGELVWKVSPGLPLEGREILVIDDVLDQGHTIGAILNALRAQNAANVRTAVLVRKDTPARKVEFTIDFCGLEAPDRYLFGSGMDYKGYFRQLPSIYAVASAAA